MPEKPDQLPSLPSASEAEAARLAARRRFTRAGLSAPVILGTLVSKPVLGAPIYHCTVSGHVSGGSPREGDGSSCQVGLSKDAWLSNVITGDWLSLTSNTLFKGTLPNSGCSWPSGQGLSQGTVFNGFSKPGLPSLANKFYGATGQAACSVSTTASNKFATMYQVLSTSDSSLIFQLGRAVVVSLLNYYRSPTNYPVTAHTIIAMFNATCNGGSYQVTTGIYWSPNQVLTYLTSLYLPGAPPA